MSAFYSYGSPNVLPNSMPLSHVDPYTRLYKTPLQIVPEYSYENQYEQPRIVHPYNPNNIASIPGRYVWLKLVIYDNIF
ncbi:unnamed protein product [Adineta steineri]|uniref:Uncharacterized protein n=1 Tax=Adineta steineri TaxID=433720 RepID=A0A814AIJ2_9BILA|nr:unnamed protein product [Adineta steineri]CAF0887119.1 unnamed protein product [Adineta steineri]CAF0912362.1 unnamed protein product [Adineta steineri]CAF3832654.1 unnamed protein product [Adineta steineri]CAF4042021.1 unnamed protein product [Adineta steineri]